MATILGTIEAVLGMDTRQFVSGAEQAKRSMGDLDRTSKSLASNLKTYAQILVGGFITKEIVGATIEAQNAIAQLDSAVKATGASSGFTTRALQELAMSLQLVSTKDDEAIIGAETLLLQFDKIGKDIFPRATKAVLDLATRMGGDLNGAAMQVGKALQEPGNGIAQLNRQFRLFSEAEVETLKGMVDTGREAEAQAIILQKLEDRFKGAAEAARNTLGGALESLKNALRNTVEGSPESTSGAVGLINAIADAISKANSKAEGLDEYLRRWAGKHEGGIFGRIDQALGLATPPKQPDVSSYLLLSGGGKDSRDLDYAKKMEDIASDAAGDMKVAANLAKLAADAEKKYRDAIKSRVDALKEALDLGTLNNTDLAAGAKLLAELLARSQDATLSLAERNLATQQLVEVATALHATENQATQAAREHAAAMSAVTAQTNRAAQAMRDYVNAGQGKTVKAPGSPSLGDMTGGGFNWKGAAQTFLLPIGQQLLQQFGGPAFGGAASGALSGALMGSAIPGIGTAIGAVLGGVGGLVGGLLGHAKKAQEAADAMRKAQDQYNESLHNSVLAMQAAAEGGYRGTLKQRGLEASKLLQDYAKLYGAFGTTGSYGYFGGGGQQKGMEEALQRGDFGSVIAALQGQLPNASGKAKQALLDLIAQLQLMQDQIEKDREAAQKNLDEDVAVRRLRVEGKNDEADILALQIEQARALAEAAAAGLDTAKLAALQADELAAAQKRQADAAAEAAKAIKKATEAFQNDIRVRELVAGGKGAEADMLRLTLQQADEMAKAMEMLEKGQITQEWIDRLQAVQDAEKKALEAEQAAGAAGSVADIVAATKAPSRVAEEVVRNVVGITSDQAIRMTDQLTTVNIWLADIAYSARYLRGDGVGIFPANNMGAIDQSLGQLADNRNRLAGLPFRV